MINLKTVFLWRFSAGNIYHASSEPLTIFWNENATTLTWVMSVLPTMEVETLGIQPVGGNTHETRVERVASSFQKILRGS